MTIEETTCDALSATEEGDLAALTAALNRRASAVALLGRMPPSQELASRMDSAIALGKILDQRMSALKARIRSDTARLASIEAVATSAEDAPPPSVINCRA
jgi:hypothetical protein